MNNDMTIVSWEESYATGIMQIDNQHRELVKLTNKLYQACLAGGETADTVFREAMHDMVEYVRYHFSAELEILNRIKYPQYKDHKSQHDTLVKQILQAVKDFEAGKKYVPHSFVRTLKDWVFGHIAFSDRFYAAFAVDQLNKGLLTAGDIEGK